MKSGKLADFFKRRKIVGVSGTILKTFRKCIINLFRKKMSVRKKARTNDGHLGYTDTLNEIWDEIFPWLGTGIQNQLL